MEPNEVIDGSSVKEGTEMIDIGYDKLVTCTDLAALFEIGDDEQWAPMSLITDCDEKSFFVPEWFAEEEGLI